MAPQQMDEYHLNFSYLYTEAQLILLIKQLSTVNILYYPLKKSLRGMAGWLMVVHATLPLGDMNLSPTLGLVYFKK